MTIQEFNKTKIGVKRAPFSKEWLENLSKAHMGQKGYWTGKKRSGPSTETREKISKSALEFWKGKVGYSKGKKLTPEHRKKISEGIPHGEQCYNWKGGISPINHKIRHSVEFKLWREAVFERDDYTCIWCGAKSGNGKAVVLHPDHIKPFCDYPELRFAIDNGRTLCVDCHKKTDTWGGRKKHE
jgi:5-methylcytosine-specific restriction endonuclease McrA